MNSEVKPVYKFRWIISFLLLVIPILICVSAIIVANLSAVQFCTLNDEVYRVIEMNVQKWLFHFQSLPENEYPGIIFSLQSGEKYTVNASTWDIGVESPELIIQTKPLRQEPYGLTGYVYMPTGNTTLDRRYQIEHLAGDIYCYRLR